MELFRSGNSKVGTIKHWIDESDVFLLMVGGRYGSIYEAENISYTEMEYRYALSKNKPIVAIVLKDEMILKKAAEVGEDKVREQNNPKKYLDFKKLVEDKIVASIADIKEISGVVHSHLNSINNDKEKELIGWVRADNAICNLSVLAQEQLQELTSENLQEYASRHYDIDVKDFINISAGGFHKALITDGILDSFHRNIDLEYFSDELIKVTITNIYNYRWLSSNHHSFGISFHSTEQQANTFKINKLLINRQDFTNNFNWRAIYQENRGQLEYLIESEDSIHIDNLPADIYYQCSYLCPPLDFLDNQSF